MYEDDENHDADIAQICEFTGVNAMQALALLRANDNSAVMAINWYTDNRLMTNGNPLPLPKLIPIAGMQTLLSQVFEHGIQYGEPRQQDLIRPPTLPQADILVDSIEAQILNRRAAIKRPRRAGAAYDGFRDFAVETNRQEEMLAMAHHPGSRLEVAAFNNLEKAQRLEDLFRPPIDIMFNGSFATARAVSEADGKWLMVNPQNSSEFCCQVLNRDVWSDPAIKSIVRANFVFWQVYIDSEEGLQYNQYYPVESFPYVSIIDPRTGELLKKWHIVTKAFFAEQLMNFLHRDGQHSSSAGGTDDAPLNLASKEECHIEYSKHDVTMTRYLKKETGGPDRLLCVELCPRDAAALGCLGGEDCLSGKTRCEYVMPSTSLRRPVQGVSAPSASVPFAQSYAKQRARRVAFAKTSTIVRENSIHEESQRLASHVDNIEIKKENKSPSTVVGNDSDAIRKSKRVARKVIKHEPCSEADGTNENQDAHPHDAINRLYSDSGTENETDDDLPAEDLGEPIQLCLRFPDKKREIVSFPVFGKIRLLQKKLGRDGYSSKKFDYVLNFPKRMLCTKKAASQTFTSLGIMHNETIYVSAKEKPGKEQFKG